MNPFKCSKKKSKVENEYLESEKIRLRELTKERIKLKELEKKFLELVQPIYDKKMEIEHNQRIKDLENFDISIVNQTRKFGDGLYMPQFDYFVYGRIIQGIEFGSHRIDGGSRFPYLNNHQDNYLLEIDYSIFPPDWGFPDFKIPENIKSIIDEINKLPEIAKKEHKVFRHHVVANGIYLKSKHPYDEFDLNIKTVRGSHTLKFPTKEISQLFYEDFKVMWNQK